MTRHQTHRATLFALVAAFGVTAAGMAISTREHAVVLPTLTDVTPATFTEGATAVGVDPAYLIVTDLPQVVAVYGTGIYPAMPSQVIDWTGPDDADSHNVG
jgi:hypothetical protein